MRLRVISVVHLSPGRGFCNVKCHSLELNRLPTEASVFRDRYFQHWKVKVRSSNMLLLS